MKNKYTNELAVCGIEAVKALAKNNQEKIRRFYYAEERKYDFSDLCKNLAAKHIPYNMVDGADLEKLSGTIHHQGVVAMIEQPRLTPLTTDITDEWLHKKESALLLDRVGNANNLGAIVRSAAFFGFKNIVIPLDEAQSSITTSSYRVAQGGLEFVNVYTVHSIEKLLKSMNGKMVRFGTDVTAKTEVSQIPALCEKKGALIILGNEEHGISDMVKENCDHLVFIPFGGEKQNIESLNVAQAASIVLYECRKLVR